MAGSEEGRHLREFFPKDIKKTVRELTTVNGITARKLNKLVGSVYDVNAKDISRAVFTSLKRGHGAPDLKTKLCGSIGGSRREDIPMKQCLNNRNDTYSEQQRTGGCPERRISQASCGATSSCGRKKRKSKCRRKRSRSKSGSCTKKKKRSTRRRRKSSCRKKRRSRRSKGCKKRKRRSQSCGDGGCKMRVGRKPCNSSKCKKKRRRSRRSGSCGGGGGCKMRVGRKPCGSSMCKKKRRRRRSSRHKTCGQVTVIYPPTVPMINNKQPSKNEETKDRITNQSSTSRESSISKRSSVWYFS